MNKKLYKNEIATANNMILENAEDADVQLLLATVRTLQLHRSLTFDEILEYVNKYLGSAEKVDISAVYYPWIACWLMN